MDFVHEYRRKKRVKRALAIELLPEQPCTWQQLPLYVQKGVYEPKETTWTFGKLLWRPTAKLSSYVKQPTYLQIQWPKSPQQIRERHKRQRQEKRPHLSDASKVVLLTDETWSKFLVVDGNHRTSYLMKRKPSRAKTWPVFIGTVHDPAVFTKWDNWNISNTSALGTF